MRGVEANHHRAVYDEGGGSAALVGFDQLDEGLRVLSDVLELEGYVARQEKLSRRRAGRSPGLGVEDYPRGRHPTS